MITDSSADQQWLVGRAADAVEQVTDARALDGSPKVLQYHPVGVYVLTMIALGLICCGVLAVIRAVYGRM